MLKQGRTIFGVLLLAVMPALAHAEQYVVRLESFRIGTTRARHEDTDFVHFALKVGAAMVGEPQTKSMGDVNDGDHVIGLQFGPFEADANTRMVFNYEILNNGSEEWDKIREQLQEASELLIKGDEAARADGENPSTVGGERRDDGTTGSIWVLVGTLGLKALLNVLIPDCDGVVALDQVSVTGADLARWTRESGAYTETRQYPGSDSDLGCGSNSRYAVTWSVVRVGSETPVIFQGSPHTFIIKSAETGKVLDIDWGSTKRGARLIQWDQHGGGSQLWRLEALSGDDAGYYIIRSAHSGLCLDVAGLNMSDHAAIVQWPYEGRDNQKWQIIKRPGTNAVALRVRHSGKVIDVPGRNRDRGVRMQQYTLCGEKNQQWILEDQGAL